MDNRRIGDATLRLTIKVRPTESGMDRRMGSISWTVHRLVNFNRMFYAIKVSGSGAQLNAKPIDFTVPVRSVTQWGSVRFPIQLEYGICSNYSVQPAVFRKFPWQWTLSCTGKILGTPKMLYGSPLRISILFGCSELESDGDNI